MHDAATLADPTARARLRAVGYAEALVSGVGFGFLGILGKAALAKGLTPGENLALRFLAAAASLWAVLLVTRGRRALLPAKDALKCAGLGVLGYAVFSSCYFEALKDLSASLTVMLLYTYPMIVALGAKVFLGQELGRRKLVSLPVVTAGLILLVWGEMTVQSAAGIAYGLSAALLYSAYILVSARLLGGIDPMVSVTYIQTAAGLALAAVHLHDPERALALIGAAWPYVLGMAIVCSVLPMVLFLRSLQKIPAADVSLLSTAEPITGVAVAAALLGERLGVGQMIGAALIIAALVYMARQRSAPV